MTLSVIIPCFNERRTIRMIVDKVKAGVAPGTEIIIVNDASTDGTGEIAARVAAYEVPAPKYRSGVLAKYARHVGSAAEGALTS